MRKSLEESWRTLESIGHEMPRRPDGTPHLSTRMPNFDDDEPVNIAFFRTMWEEAELSGLTLPRMYIARSGFERVNFVATDLTESRMCWNDFVRCDFSRSVLARCDLRASRFDRCAFRKADLSGADLRRSSYEGCIFEGAKMTGAILHRRSAADELVPLLSKSQLEEVQWVGEEGEEPPGG